MILLIASPQKGTGKTTIATNLAVSLAHKGIDVCIIDTAPHASATSWSRVRQNSRQNPFIPVFGLSGAIRHDLSSLADKFDVIIVDTGGNRCIEIREAAMVADTWLIPTLPNQLSILALWSALDLCRQIEIKTGRKPDVSVLFNRVDTLPYTQGVHDWGNLFDGDEFSSLVHTCPVHICNHLDYIRAPRTGEGVQEYAPKGKAAMEINALKGFVICERDFLRACA